MPEPCQRIKRIHGRRADFSIKTRQMSGSERVNGASTSITGAGEPGDVSKCAFYFEERDRGRGCRLALPLGDLVSNEKVIGKYPTVALILRMD